MKSPTLKCALALAVAGILAAGPVMAKNDKHDRDDNRGKHGAGKDDRRDDKHDRPDDRSDQRGHFEERHRLAVQDYYGQEFRKGHCPPGLKKKHNGCMPPGQAKKWHVGQPLAREVVYYAVPQPLVVRIGPPPSGYRYVRVADDILMISIGTRMVVDAIQNLTRS
jgi:Ni/Co efflux regulator RcnB